MRDEKRSIIEKNEWEEKRGIIKKQYTKILKNKGIIEKNEWEKKRGIIENSILNIAEWMRDRRMIDDIDLVSIKLLLPIKLFCLSFIIQSVIHSWL